MRRVLGAGALALILVFIAAGCGGDDGNGNGDGDGGGAAPEPQETETREAETGGGEPVGDRGGREAAEAFTACFDESGYSEQITSEQAGNGASAETIARSQGYEVAGVFINSEDGAFKSAWVTFFENQAKREEAERKFDRLFGSADVPKGDVSGAAGVTYVTRDAQEALQEPITACLG